MNHECNPAPSPRPCQAATDSMRAREDALEALRQSQQQLQAELRDAAARLQAVDKSTGETVTGRGGGRAGGREGGREGGKWARVAVHGRRIGWDC